MSMVENSQPMPKVIEWILGFFEFLVVLIKIVLLSVQALFQVFVPPEEKSVSADKILITGTGHGIGKELAKQYGELGATIVCVDINHDTNMETVAELRKVGIKAYGFECDVSKREKVQDLAKKVQSEVGDITILVNNAGIMPVKRLSKHTQADIVRIFQINVFAHFWLMEAFLPSMVEKNYGHVVALSSIAGLMGLPNIVPYCGSKFAVRGLMEATAEEFREMKKNINFTTVYPHMTDTGLCKNPKNKFPNAFPIQTPQQIASNIIKAQRRGWREVSVPNIIKPIHNVGRLFSEKAQMCLVDYLDSGVSEE